MQASWAADPEHLTPCLAVGNLSGSVTDDVLHEAFRMVGAINARVVPAPAAAAVTCGFVWFECGPVCRTIYTPACLASACQGNKLGNKSAPFAVKCLNAAQCSCLYNEPACQAGVWLLMLWGPTAEKGLVAELGLVVAANLPVGLVSACEILRRPPPSGVRESEPSP